LVHPNPASLYANVEALGESKKGGLRIRVSTRDTRMKENDVALSLKTLTTWTDWIFEELVNLDKKFS